MASFAERARRVGRVLTGPETTIFAGVALIVWIAGPGSDLVAWAVDAVASALGI